MGRSVLVCLLQDAHDFIVDSCRECSRSEESVLLQNRLKEALKQEEKSEKELVMMYRRSILVNDEYKDALREGLSKEAAKARANERADAMMRKYWP